MPDASTSHPRAPGRPWARRALALGLALAVVAAGVVFGGGWWVGERVEQAISHRIEQRLPGARATVQISSFPFLGRLAASGTIVDLHVQVTHLSAGPVVFNDVTVPSIDFASVDVVVHRLRLRTGQLLHRRVVVAGLAGATLSATVRQDALDQAVGLPVTLNAGTVGIGGLTLPATATVDGGRVTIDVPGRLSLSLATPPSEVLPCNGRVVIVPGALVLTCQVHHLPAVLHPAVYEF